MKIDNLYRHANKFFLVLLTVMLFAGCAGKNAEPEEATEDSVEAAVDTEEAVPEAEEELLYGEPFNITSIPSDMEVFAEEHGKDGMELYGWQIATGMGSEVVASAETKGFLEFLFTSTGGSGTVTMTPVYRKAAQ